MIEILIADDHSIVRSGLKHIVNEESDIRITGEAEDAAQLMELLRKKRFDVLVLDINMPGRSGMDILKDVREEFPAMPVLILSMYSEEQYGIRALKAGASGYVKKVSVPEELVKAIRKVHAGGKYISPRLAEMIAGELEPKNNSLPHESLSDREFQVMCLIASGSSIEEIGDKLSLSVNTIYTYRARIFDKMNIKSNVELTQYAIRNRLIE